MGEVGSNRNGTSGTVPSPCLRSPSSAMAYSVFSLSFIGRR